MIDSTPYEERIKGLLIDTLSDYLDGIFYDFQLEVEEKLSDRIREEAFDKGREEGVSAATSGLLVSLLLKREELLISYERAGRDIPGPIEELLKWFQELINHPPSD